MMISQKSKLRRRRVLAREYLNWLCRDQGFMHLMWLVRAGLCSSLRLCIFVEREAAELLFLVMSHADLHDHLNQSEQASSVEIECLHTEYI